MLLSSTGAFSGNRHHLERRSCPHGVRPCGRRALHVTAAKKWTIGSIVGAFQDAFKEQETLPASARPLVFGPQAELQPHAPMPATFQRLSSQLVVLLDPKNERLVYLVGFDQASSTDSIVAQLRPLLRAAAAPYLHLLALPARLRTSLLREFPGGRPIITQVPLPPQAAPQDSDPQPCPAPAAPAAAATGDAAYIGIGSSSSTGGIDATAGGESAGAEAAFPRGGVLEWLYGSSQQQQRQQQQLLPEASGGDVSYGAGAEEEQVYGSDPAEDEPDEVLSRRKKMRSLMAWLKGTSIKVALRRERRTPYKLNWLVSEFNRFGVLNVAVATDDIIFVRNGILENWATDSASTFYGTLFPRFISSSDVEEEEVDGDEEVDEEEMEGEEEEEEEEADGVDGVPIAIALTAEVLVGGEEEEGEEEEEEEGAEGPALHAEALEAGEERDLAALLQLQAFPAVHGFHDGDEDDEAGEEEDDEEEEEEEEGAAVEAAAAAADEEEEAEEEDEEEEEEEEVVVVEMVNGEDRRSGRLPPAVLLLRGPQAGADRSAAAAVVRHARRRQLTPAEEEEDEEEANGNEDSSDEEKEEEEEEVVVANASANHEDEAGEVDSDLEDSDDDDDDDDEDEDEEGVHVGLLSVLKDWMEEVEEEDDDPPFNLDAQLSGGPMGWTLSLRLRPEAEDEGGGSSGNSSAEGDALAASREALEEAYNVDVERLAEMRGDLERLWNAPQASEQQQQQIDAPGSGSRPLGQEQARAPGHRQARSHSESAQQPAEARKPDEGPAKKQPADAKRPPQHPQQPEPRQGRSGMRQQSSTTHPPPRSRSPTGAGAPSPPARNMNPLLGDNISARMNPADIQEGRPTPASAASSESAGPMGHATGPFPAFGATGSMEADSEHRAASASATTDRVRRGASGASGSAGAVGRTAPGELPAELLRRPAWRPPSPPLPPTAAAAATDEAAQGGTQRGPQPRASSEGGGASAAAASGPSPPAQPIADGDGAASGVLSPSPSPPLAASSPSLEGVVLSTRLRRGAEPSAAGICGRSSDASSDGAAASSGTAAGDDDVTEEGTAANDGDAGEIGGLLTGLTLPRSRMVRRPRRFLRHGAQQQQQRLGSSNSGDAANCSGSAEDGTGPASLAPASPDVGTGPATPPVTASEDSAHASSSSNEASMGSSGGIGEELSIPAYRDVRQSPQPLSSPSSSVQPPAADGDATDDVSPGDDPTAAEATSGDVYFDEALLGSLYKSLFSTEGQDALLAYGRGERLTPAQAAYINGVLRTRTGARHLAGGFGDKQAYVRGFGAPRLPARSRKPSAQLRRRLTIPARVLSLVGSSEQDAPQGTEAAQELGAAAGSLGAEGTAAEGAREEAAHGLEAGEAEALLSHPAEEAAERAGGVRAFAANVARAVAFLPMLAARVLGKGLGLGSAAPQQISRPPHRSLPPPPPPPVLEPSKEELAAEAALAALDAATLVERQRADALVAFLRGRKPQQAQQVREWEREQAGGLGMGLGFGGPHLSGLPGLVRGQDAVVVLPRELLEATAGAWHAAEERLMHPDILRARQRRRS